ncbi:hypothetical protein [Dietzia sp. WMMA184]|uniref:hypothetical protein n=1 Tax=Dietzia sp. WMMA184 TaxID=2039808 RepID=UPI0011784576|nr:hypothetical protein [Dietzia sp. WMMA184]
MTQGLFIEWEPGARLVPVGDVFLPEVLRVDGRVSSTGPTLTVVITVIEGIPRCTEVELRESPECPEVRARDLAAVRLEDVLEAATALSAYRAGEDGAMVRVSPKQSDRAADLRAIRAARSQTRRKVTPELLAEVADLYRAFFDDSPIERIATAFQVSERTAARYVQLCRRGGHLPPTTPGKKAK